jgi:hypothetical protein
MSDKKWLEKVITAADIHCENPNVDETQIDMFLEYLFRVYGYTDLLKMRKNK